MAANRNTPETEDGESSLFNPKSPHFFKIINDGMGQSQKLTIPRYFIRKYAVDLAKSEFVILKVPTGAVWRVGLSIGDDGSVWLVNGWSDFVKFYSIKLGDFLVFCYKPVSLNEFDVVLFDRSATEIEYRLKDRVTPSRVTVEELSDGDDDDDDDDDVDVTLIHETYGGLVSSSRINRRKSRGLSGNSRTLKGTEKLEALGRAKHFRSSNPQIFRATRTVASCPSLSQDNKIRAGIMMHEGRSGSNSSSRLEQDRKCQQKIQNPLRTRPVDHLAKSKSPCFHIVMTKRYLSRHQPFIPLSFTRDHLNINIKEQTTTLKVKDRSWPATFIIYNPSTSLNSHRARFGFGFKAFAKENSLQNGDLCTFELIQKAEMIFRVSISRAKKEPIDSSS